MTRHEASHSSAQVFASKLDEYNKEFERQQKRLKELRRQGKVSKDLGKKDGGADSASYKKQMAQARQLVMSHDGDAGCSR